MPRRKATRPKLFQNINAPKQHMQSVGNALIKGTLDAGVKALNQSSLKKEAKVVRKPKYLQVTEERMKKLGVIDLKPFYANSGKRKQKAGGGWYMTIPIKRTARGLSRRAYEQLRGINISPDSQRTVISDYLYDRRLESGASMLNYNPRSNNITKIRQRKNRHTYVAFRTVSDKSPASSWIVNRSRINEQDQSKTFVRNVNKLMTWKMKNGWQ